MSTVSCPSSAVDPPADPLGFIAEALFKSMGVDGVYARTALYVHVVEHLEAYITRQRDPRAEIMRFPPVMSRKQLEKSGYLKSFPNLLGCVCALHGSEASIRSAVERHDNGGDWTTSATSSAVAARFIAVVVARNEITSDGSLPVGATGPGATVITRSVMMSRTGVSRELLPLRMILRA